MANLGDIRRRTDAIGRISFQRTGLAAIHGGGAYSSPKMALVFMNPTQRNLSSQPGWSGPRFPFIGTPRIWRLLGACQLLDKPAATAFAKPAAAWSTEDALELEKRLQQASLYITNVIKETAPDSQPPARATFRRYEQLLYDELELVKPQLVVAFGLAVHKSLTGITIRMSAVYETALHVDRVPLVGTCRGRPVAPCYFPVGRGNPQRAAVMLKMIAAGKVGPPPDSVQRPTS